MKQYLTVKTISRLFGNVSAMLMASLRHSSLMFTLLSCVRPERECASILRIARWGRRDHSRIRCPRCHSDRVKKDGHYRSYQKYFCHSCERSFNDKTGTLFHYSRTPLNIWFLALYLFFVLWIGSSILEISKEFLIPYYRCYGMIRTIMERISAIESRKGMLKKKVESDEFYMKAGLKGRSFISWRDNRIRKGA